jgi:hypothetical protein
MWIDITKSLDHDVRDEAPLEIKTAPEGSTVIMECKTDLEPPVTYLWTKQGQDMPDYVDVYRVSICQIGNLRDFD